MSGLSIQPIKCPNCDAFVGQKRSYCPFCHHSLAGASWKQPWTITSTIVLVVLILTWVSDRLLGTQIAETVKTMLAGK